MTHLLTAAALYAAFIAHVAWKFGVPGDWTPNLTLLVGLAVARSRGGLMWAALAGLLCDGLCGRPLGVTMLVATLAVTVARQTLPARDRGAWLRIVVAFAGVALVEAVARILAGTASASPDHMAELLAAAKSAVATASFVAVAFAMRGVTVGLWHSLMKRSDSPTALLSAVHR